MRHQPLRDWRRLRRLAQDRRKNRFEASWRAGDLPDWRRLDDGVFVTELLGDGLEFWPDVARWFWRGETACGDVFAFIEARKKEAAKGRIHA